MKKIEDDNATPINFSVKVKSRLFMDEALSKSIRCKLCGGLIDQRSISYDHIKRKSQEGVGSQDNAQLSHPYCNVVYKN